MTEKGEPLVLIKITLFSNRKQLKLKYFNPFWHHLRCLFNYLFCLKFSCSIFRPGWKKVFHGVFLICSYFVSGADLQSKLNQSLPPFVNNVILIKTSGSPFSVICELNRFLLSCLGHLVSYSQRLVNYLAFL
jgi:hypothetical protein